MNKKLPSLHTMTTFSFLESAISIDNLIAFAKKNNLDTLVLTDHNSLFGAIEFIEKCKKNGIKPIIGIDIDIDDYRLILIAKNYEGYKNINYLGSLIKKEQKIKIEDISIENVFIIDHPKYGYYLNHKKILMQHQNFFITHSLNEANSLPVNFIRNIDNQDKERLDLILALTEKKNDSKDKSYEEIWNVNIPDIPYKNWNFIINNSNFGIVLDKKSIPSFKNFSQMNSKDFLKELIAANFKKMNYDVEKKERYIKRLDYEYSVITKLNFEDYILIIWDIVKYAKDNNIIVGPGRGSAAGSLIAFVLNITEIDPIENQLFFERFLNPERVSMPDIDLDIQDDRRMEIIHYVFKKYGEDKVAHISTFSNLAAKSSLRDVARLLGYKMSEINLIAKSFPNNMTLEEGYKTKAKFRASIDANPKNTKLFNLARKIEGIPRHQGTHAAGVIISNKRITDLASLTLSSDGLNQVQTSMDYLDAIGLLKIDILGLKNLSIIRDIQSQIFNNYGKKIDLLKIPLNDKKTNDILSNGMTKGLFQLESPGMRGTLQKIGVSNFKDLAIIISLYRPGPMEFIDEFALRRSKKKQVPKILKEYDQLLIETEGIIVYQEQIMELAKTLAGMSFSRADILRKAIGKKNEKLILSLKKEFIDGMIENNFPKEIAEKIYGMIEKFANYGFNKSHAYSYAVLGYRMAYLKSRFPLEFYTALLQANLSSSSAIEKYVEEIKKQEINIVLPTLKLSLNFVKNQDQKIILPFNIIKGLGGVVCDKIVHLLNEHKISDFFEFVAQSRNGSIGEGIISLLIKGNVLSEFGNIETLIKGLPQALRYYEMIKVKKDGKETLDFSLLPKPNLEILPENIKNKQKYQKEVFGFVILDSPTKKYENKNKISNLKVGVASKVVAQIVASKTMVDKNGRDMIILKLIDSTSSIEAKAFFNIASKVKKVEIGKIVEVELKKTIYNERESFLINSVWKEINE